VRLEYLEYKSSHAEEGLLGSVLIYFAAMFALLALFVVPVLWANGPTIKENVGPDYARDLLASRGDDNRFPVAKLEHQELVNPARYVELTAKAKRAQTSRPLTDRAHQTPQALQWHAAQRAQAKKVRQAQIANSYIAPPRAFPWEY
jgi:hypothetical protein